MSGANGGAPKEMVTLTIDGKSVTVPKGTNLIQSAKAAGIDIPYYCYHPHLSVPGNCRMCQVEVTGQPKLLVGCHAQATPNMEVKTHHTSEAVKDAQAATLEFILINHPLDCTVCDQAGHCKLQDYHFDYNARPSRFLEKKVHKVKAEPLGPHVILDGERCIMCTRCIRFCDEITKTSELGMLNRGDRSVIAINPGKELNNPLSGTVVDLCPVGALTHRDWRFNTRIWFTTETDSICPGCSTGCNVKVAVRDGEVVQVKARENSAVNKEWLCDEGRYGFMRFLPKNRVMSPRVSGTEATLDAALKEAIKLREGSALVLVAPDLLLEEYVLIRQFIERVVPGADTAIAYKERSLTPVESILISPDYAANFRAAEFSGLVSGNIAQSYADALSRLTSGAYKRVLIVGDKAIDKRDLTAQVASAVRALDLSVGVFTDADLELTSACSVVFPGRSILEKSGLMINRQNRLQYSDRVIDFPTGTEPAWRFMNQLAQLGGRRVVEAESDRDLTLAYLKSEPRLSGLTIRTIKAGGVALDGAGGKASKVEASTGASQV